MLLIAAARYRQKQSGESGRWARAESVRDLHKNARPTGLLFPKQTASCVVDAVEAFERAGPVFDPQACREWAETFSEENFRRSFTDLVNEAWSCWQADSASVEAAILNNFV